MRFLGHLGPESQHWRRKRPRYIEFQLLAQPCDLPKQTPLAIVAGADGLWVYFNGDTLG